MKKLIFLCIAIAFSVIRAIICYAQEVNWENISRENLFLNTVLVNRDNPTIIYAGSNNAVMKTEDAGDSWQNILTIKGENKKVNLLAFDRKNSNHIYAATGNGLFYSNNQGKNWKKIFKGKDYLESDCGAVWACEKNIYLGTHKGLFISKDAGQSWRKAVDKLANSRICSIVVNNEFSSERPQGGGDEANSRTPRYDLRQPNYRKPPAHLIYVASEDGVFLTKNDGNLWERIFFSHSDKTGAANEEPINEEEKSGLPPIQYLTADPNNQNYLYLATPKGVYKNFNSGTIWDLLPNYGLLNIDIRFLAIYSDSSLYAISKSGIFQFKADRWHEISLGLNANYITSLDFDNQSNLYAASDKGIFLRKNTFTANKMKINKIAGYSENEPKIRDIQEAAIKYAEVSPEKILKWRQQAQKMAFLPKISTSMNRNTSDLRHWESGSTTKSGDDTLNKGRDSIEWDISLSWDLGQIIWNNDQTSIDARSRLMAELRDNILDEVTKLYFERLRVKMELDNLAIEDNKKRFEKELKLQELTALIDAFTNGYFSQQISK